MKRTLAHLSLIAFLLLPLACGGDEQTQKEPEKTPSGTTLASFTLKTEPANALTVLDAKQAAPKEEVVVTGRIATVVEGLAAFQLVDESLEYCGQTNKEDKCGTPWDYCCIPQEERVAATILVEARDEDGNVITADELPGLRLIDLVVVKGSLKKDEQGNVTLHATGWIRKERPTVHDGVRWPE